MLVHIQGLLQADEVRQARQILDGGPWQDGRLTAGEQSARAKRNEQLREDCEETRAAQRLLLAGLERHALFFSAALPKQISPPLFNRYGGSANSFGNHVDSAGQYVITSTPRIITSSTGTTARYTSDIGLPRR